MLTRTLGRTLRAGDEILVTRLDHDGNVVAVARARARPRPEGRLRRDARRHDARLRRPRAEAHRPHARRRVPARLERGRDAHRRAAHRRARARRGRARLGGRRALRAARADRRRRRSASTSSSARRTSSSARISGSRSCRAELLESWRPYKVRPRPTIRFETGRSRTSCSPASSPRSSTSSRSAGPRSRRTSARSGSSSSTACPTAARSTGCRRWTAACRRSRSTSTGARRAPSRSGSRERDIAVWDGNYYAVEVMERLGLGDGGRGARRLRPLQHGGRGRPAARARSESCDRRRRAPARPDPLRHDEPARATRGRASRTCSVCSTTPASSRKRYAKDARGRT